MGFFSHLGRKLKHAFSPPILRKTFSSVSKEAGHAFSQVGNFVKHAGGKVLNAGKKVEHKVEETVGPIVKQGLDSLGKVVSLPGKIADAQGKVLGGIGNFGNILPWAAAGLIGLAIINADKIGGAIHEARPL